MSTIYRSGRAAIPTITTTPVQMLLLTASPEEAFDETLATVTALLAVSGVVEATGVSYARRSVLDIAVAEDAGEKVLTHTAVTFPAIDVGTVTAIVYATNAGALISIHEVTIVTTGTAKTITAAGGWLRLTQSPLALITDDTLAGEGTEGSPLGVSEPVTPIAVTSQAAGPIDTIDGPIIEITSGVESGGVVASTLVTPSEGDPIHVFVRNNTAYPLRLTPNSGTIDGAATMDVAARTTVSGRTVCFGVFLSWNGTKWLATETGGVSAHVAAADPHGDRAYTDAAIAALIGAAPSALNTLVEIATALGNDAALNTTLVTSIGTKLTKASNLSDLTDASAARTNLGLAIGTNVQAYDADLANIAGLATTTWGRALLTQADAAAARTTIDVYSKAEVTASEKVIRETIVGNRQTANYTAVASDAGKVIEMNLAGANTVTINDGVHAANDVFTILQYGAGTTTLVAGAGVTLNRKSGVTLALAGQWCTVTVRCLTASTFHLTSGGLA